MINEDDRELEKIKEIKGVSIESNYSAPLFSEQRVSHGYIEDKIYSLSKGNAWIRIDAQTKEITEYTNLYNKAIKINFKNGFEIDTVANLPSGEILTPYMQKTNCIIC